MARWLRNGQIVTSITPSAPSKFDELDEPTNWLLLDPSPEAQIAWAESLLTIDNEHGAIVAFKTYPQQRMMAMEATGRDNTVKGRQTRASSWILARNLRRMTTGNGLKCVIGTQDDQTTATFKARLNHHLKDLARFGLEYKLEKDNKDEIVISGLENRFMFVSGHERVTGRAYTGHIVHFSEVSHWDNDNARKLLGDIIPAVPGPPHGWFDIESTPNGAEGAFYEYVIDAKPKNPDSMWTTHFYPWWLEPRYRIGLDPMTCDKSMTPEEYARRRASFAPTFDETKLMEGFGLDEDQMIWRRIQTADLAKTSVPFSQEYPEDIDGCFVSASDNYFASPDGVDHLRWYRDQNTPPVLKFEELRYRGGMVSFYGPNLSVWEPPQPGATYCGYIDCAGGVLDVRSDNSALTVIDVHTLRNVATLWLKCAPDELAPMACAVMEYYNRGTLGGERDAFGLSCLNKIKELMYPNLWYYIDPNNPPEMNHVMEAWAHPTQTRDKVLMALRASVFTHRFLTNNGDLTREMGSFTWLKLRSRQQMKAAGRGMKDDLVLSAAGAVFMAPSIAAGTSARTAGEARSIMVGLHGLVTHANRNWDDPQGWMR